MTTTTTSTTITTTTRAALQAALPACTIVYGTRTSGPGPARFGWHVVTAAGYSRFLGQGAAAVEAAKALGALFGT